MDDMICTDYKGTAKILGVCERTVWSLVKEGELEAIKIGRSVRITHKAIKDFLSNSEKVKG